MMVLGGYALLAVITFGYAWCARLLYRRTGDVSVPIGLALIYLWTFAGAWLFIGDSAVGFQGYHIGFSYYYLMEKMFPFVLNGNYLLALAAYALFAAGVVGTLLVLVPRGPVPAQKPITLDHRYLLVGGFLCLTISVVTAVPVMQKAWAAGEPFYIVMHKEEGLLKTLRAWSDRCASVAFVFGYIILLTQGHPRSLFTPRTWPWLRVAYPAAFLVLGVYLSLLGDRHTLFTVLILALVYLFDRLRKQGFRRAVMPVGLMVVMLAFGGWVRGFTPQGERTPLDRSPFALSQIAHVPRQQEGSVRKAGAMVFSNELFAAHFSMYGVLERNVPLAPWSSFRYLGASVMPSALRVQEPPMIYTHYAKEARLAPGQGYTIHHATGWYLNMGWPGLLIGGAVLGGAWGLLLRARSKRIRPGLERLLWLMSPYLLVAYLPPVLRDGPEMLRALLFEGLVMPMLLLCLAAGLRWPWRIPEPANG